MRRERQIAPARTTVGVHGCSVVCTGARVSKPAPAGANKERGYTMQEAWEGFEGGTWTDEVDVRDFIQRNYTPYEGDESFLAGPTQRTKDLWDYVMGLLTKEREKGGCLDMDTKVVTGIVSHPAGYIDNEHPERETIVGLQTDKPLKRALHVNISSRSRHRVEVEIPGCPLRYRSFSRSRSMTSRTCACVSNISSRALTEPGMVRSRRSICSGPAKESREQPSSGERSLVLKGLSPGIISR